MSMLAGWYEQSGPAKQVIQIGQMDQPQAGPGEVLVRLHASGINPSDYKKRGNSNTKLEFPRIVPHSDGAGRIAGLGAGVEGYKIGERVWVFNAQWKRAMGTAAQYIAVPAQLVRRLPAHVSFVEGACLGIPAMTGYRAVFADGPVRGKTVYIPAATGRVGAYAVQFAKWGGARVIASVSSEEKAAMARGLKADVVLNRSSDNLIERVLAETDQKGVDHIVEIDLGGNMPISEKILAENGSICSYASAQSSIAHLNIGARRARNMSVRVIFVYLLSPSAIEDTCSGIIQALHDTAIHHRIAGVFPLSELAQAHETAEQQSGLGHMVIEID
jgi:NADPH2:quinone reductase